jgi:peroxiredoxin
MEIKKLFALLGFLLLLVTSVFIYSNKNMPPQAVLDTNEAHPILKVGHKPPELKLTDLDGNIFELSSLKGRVVLINFWATWCPPCITEMPSLAAAYRKLASQGFEILAISLDEKRSVAKDLATKMNLPFKVIMDKNGKISKQYLVYGLPYTVILDRKGIVRYKIFGGHEWDEGAQFKLLTDLL